MKAAFTVTGLEDAVVTPANTVLPPGKEVKVVISGNAVSDKVTVDARGPFGLRQSVTKIRRVPDQEISGVIPKNTKLQFINDSGIDILAHTTGEQIINSDGSASLEAKKGISKPGFLAYGPYSSLNAGRYLALFRVKRIDEGSGDAAEADIVSGGHPIGASRMIKASELPIGEYRSFALIFDYNQSGSAYESRVSWKGNASLVFDRVIIWKIIE
jgi:hypothetical protein